MVRVLALASGVMARKIVMILSKCLTMLVVSRAKLSSTCHAAPWGPYCTPSAGCRFSCSICCVMAPNHHSERDVSPGPLPDRKLLRDKHGLHFFSNASQWGDNRSEKSNVKFSNFKHDKTPQGLRNISDLNNPWLEAELDTERDVSPNPPSCRKMTRDRLWQDLCSDPSQWWDNRAEKVNPKYPDFEHKTSRHGLWLDSRLKPPWVEAELAAMAPGILQPHIFSWHARLRRYVEAGEYTKTLNLFQQMQREGMMPDKFTFIPLLNACSNLRSLEAGRRVHEQIIQNGCESDIYVATCLVDMYAKCGNIGDAWSVFDKMRERDVVSWSALIAGYVKSEQGLKALELFRKMQQEGVEPDAFTFVGALNACTSVGALENGRRVHKQIIGRGLGSDVYVANCLVDMYAKCGAIEDAWSVFNKMTKRDVVSWSAMIVGYVKAEQGLKALELFHKMQQEGVKPNTVTFVGALNACASVAALEEGKGVHKLIIQNGCESDVYVSNCLVDMYAKCRSIEDAWSVFHKMRERGVVSWTAMIQGYVKSEQGLKALELFRRMQQEGVEPDAVTFVGALNACASVAALEEGRRVHQHIIQSGWDSNVYVANCLVDMYAKCGSVEDAWSVFNRMREHDVVSWSAMIVGYVKANQALKALELFHKMQQDGVKPNTVTFVGALNACASLAALAEGRLIHKQIIRSGCQSDVYVANCLVDMYAKCGSIKDARTVFNKMQERDVVSWGAMIGGYAIHGHSKKAIDLFERMGKEGVETDEITFISILSACSHGGLVEEGLRYFNTMTSHYNVRPTREHYACMVDLLGRAGWLDEAEGKADEMMKRMPMERDSCVWMTLLGACRIHGNIEMAERIAKRCWDLEPQNASAYVLLWNIYAAAGNWDSCAAIEKERLKRKTWKVPGRTWVEVKNLVHSFLVNDEEHPQLLQIHARLERLSVQMNEAGYIPDTRFWSSEATSECHLCRHSEKLAIALRDY